MAVKQSPFEPADVDREVPIDVSLGECTGCGKEIISGTGYHNQHGDPYHRECFEKVYTGPAA